LRIVRQIVLDTETTGLELSEGHRVIEIGCVELLHRRPSGRTWHRYLRPEREVEAGALAVHGITNEFLAGQPRFAEIAGEFLEFIAGSELVIHNAEFDVGFLDAELAKTGTGRTIGEHCTVLDTLLLARRMHPGQRNSLDALCKRYGVDNTRRDLHGALLDARILADVYLAMSGGQAAFSLDNEPEAAGPAREASRRTARGALHIPVIPANAAELAAHEELLDSIERTTGGPALFRQSDGH
jgi:DNA polymerase-3 subunit epsilon